MEILQFYESFNDIYETLPVTVYKHDLTGKKIYSHLHWHRSLELTITIFGCIQFNLGSTDLHFTAADWILVGSGELHSCRYIAENDRFVGISLLIDPAFADKWLTPGSTFINPNLPQVNEEMQRVASRIYDLSEEDPAYRFKLMSCVYELFGILETYCNSSTVATMKLPRDSSDTFLFTRYIEAHFTENLTLEDMAEHFGYSVPYFSRLFKDNVGTGFHAYLNYVRVCHAQSTMTAGTNITECAYNSGFPNVKSFINTFKKVYGCTPGAYLNMQTTSV